MERRELLKAMSASLGASIALPESVFGRLAEPFDPNDLKFFRPRERAQVAMIAEAIIPRTDTPGAIDAGVPGWIEVIVQDCLPAEDQQVIQEGLADLMRRCQKEHGKDIGQLEPDQQVAFLTKMHKDTLREKQEARKAGENPRRTFLEQFKDLTKFCFASSEVGATEAFEFVYVPGQWIPSMPLKEGQKAWAL
ncbi:MAG: gluconate 2-dehydrogenase subunit 3 family protein [Akkermansiaceae bacterium]|jgi:hypothetical protein